MKKKIFPQITIVEQKKREKNNTRKNELYGGYIFNQPFRSR
jgi:hypothetical protein